MAGALQHHYEKVYPVPRFSDVEQAVDAWSGPDKECVLEDVELSEAGIIEAASRMADHLAAGPDAQCFVRPDTRPKIIFFCV